MGLAFWWSWLLKAFGVMAGGDADFAKIAGTDGVGDGGIVLSICLGLIHGKGEDVWDIKTK